VDVPGLCKVASRKLIESQGWSLNPGRYVGAAAKGAEDVDFTGRLEELAEELEVLNSAARELEDQIANNLTVLLEGAE
jgi:type I restriction enzyme M protein